MALSRASPLAGAPVHDTADPTLVLARALSFAGLAGCCRAACASRLWCAASVRVEAWAGVRITARRPVEKILPDGTLAPPDAHTELGMDNIHHMDDATLQALVSKMRRVGEEHALVAVPPPCGDGAPRSRQTPLHLRRLEVEGSEYWLLCYNTDFFGWFDAEHTTAIPCGLKIWAPCPLLCRWFSQPAEAACGGDLRGQSVLELGSGIGMLGIVMASRARRVVITDIDVLVLRVVAANAHLNGVSNVGVRRLPYGRADAARFRAEHGCFDRIVGADIIYALAVVRPIFETVDELLGAHGTFSLGFVERSEQFTAAVQAAAHELGLAHAREPELLVRLLRDEEPEEDEPALVTTGLLAELQALLKRIPQSGPCTGEAADRARLLEFRRRSPAPLDLNSMD